MPMRKYVFLQLHLSKLVPPPKNLAFPGQTISSASVTRLFGGLIKMPVSACGGVFGGLITEVARSYPRHGIPSVNGTRCAF